MNKKIEKMMRPSGRREERFAELRLRYLYQHLVLSGQARISLAAARGLLGPDRAYHLYTLSSRTGDRQRRSRSRP